MANELADKGDVVNAPNQGAMKTILGNWRDFTSNLLGGGHFETFSPAEFTLSSGILSVSQDYGIGGYINASRAAGITTAFDLTGITATNFRPGNILIVGTEAGKPMTVHHQQSGVSNGQILLRGGQDVTLSDQESSLALRLESQTGPWREVWRSAATASGGFSGMNIRTILSNGNYTKPSNLVSALVIVQGAGGGGAGKPRTNSQAITVASGGGGAGGTALKIFNADDLPPSCPMTVGTGGDGGSDSTTYTAGNTVAGFAKGATGGTSSFSGTGITTMTAGGGAPGWAYVRGRSGIGLQAGVNDNASAKGGIASGGDINLRGNSGDPGLAMDIDDGTRKHNELGGRGGSSWFAAMPEIAINQAARAGHAGSYYGAGGNAPTGSVASFTSSYNGAPGGHGVIYIVEFLN